MLKIQFTDRRKSAMWLVDSTLKIGSDPTCDIFINEPSIDLVHVELVINQDNILLKNINKKRSVFVNEIPVVGEHPLNAWDVIKVGESELEIIDPLSERSSPPSKTPEQATVIRPVVSLWMLKGATMPLDGQYFSLSNGMIIGRENTNDIKIPLSYVSRQHAKISLQGKKIFVDDLGSSNGTYVNGERIKSRELFNGDELRLDEFIFYVIGPEEARKQQSNNQSEINSDKNDADGFSNPEIKRLDSLNQKVYLHGVSDDVAGQVFEIDRVETHISRMLGHHLSRSDESVSARHVYLYATNMGWQIKNDGASDGLLVNGKMCSNLILQEDDEILVGGTALRLLSYSSGSNHRVLKEVSKKSGKFIFLSVILAVAVGVITYLLFK